MNVGNDHKKQEGRKLLNNLHKMETQKLSSRVALMLSGSCWERGLVMSSLRILSSASEAAGIHIVPSGPTSTYTS